ncbi:S-adenosyl-L-methionine-dependent methyltransferase superfamily protein [Abeliophyllum distichum]|uniref:S-adenosyl-L-methionine-dependent methyltransferase superfamily protein n=1 Tax=Abeliophyllum distichum TaxID=126358 RepID=A0ABD1QJY8_9LAMI
MASVRFFPNSCMLFSQKITKSQTNFKFFVSASPFLLSKLHSIPRKASIFTHSLAEKDVVTSAPENPSSNSISKYNNSPFQGLDDIITGYIFGKKKATEVAHSVWKNVIRKGDVVVDATCGNGYDTLAMLRLVADETRRGRVYAMDLQKVALENTYSLLGQSVNSDERELVELYAICHTKMEEIVPSGAAVRLVAFNLGYLPGGDKKIITRSETTLHALEASKRVLAPGGLISIVVYVGHAGGRDEFETVQAFASELPVDNWVCCKLQMLNRPLAPVP